MDFQSIGRTWTGNIYHKFESIFQEVDDFVTKDTLKYLENQVQIVGEGVKKVYDNVLHDFAPPMGFNKEMEACASKKPNDILNPGDFEKNLTKEKHSIYPNLKCGDSPPLITNIEECPLTVKSDSVERSSVLENPLKVTSKSLESNSFSQSEEKSNVEGCTCSTIVTEFSTENLVEVLELKTDKICKAITTLSLKPVTPFFKTSDMDSQTNALNEDILVSDVNKHRNDTNFDESAEVEGKDDAVECTSCVVECENAGAVYMGDEHLIGEASNSLSNEVSEHGDDIHSENYVNLELLPKLQAETDYYLSIIKEDDNDIPNYTNQKIICEATKKVPFDEMLTSNSVDIDESNLETIDLTDKVKVEEGSIVVDDWLIHTASIRPRRFKSYKRLIKDMFTSRKRMIKEYKQLAILCGEIDGVSNLQQQDQSHFRHVTAAAAAAALCATPSVTCDSCEFEWELL